MVDQKTIAARAGVSPATVSRAFTGSANISPKTLSKIQQAMEELGLQPPEWQPDGNSKRSRHVLILVGDISSQFCTNVIKGICNRLLSLGLLGVVVNSNFDLETEEQQILMADAEQYLGIILVTAQENPTLVAALEQVRIPVILVNRYLNSFVSDSVCFDNFRGGYMAAQHLAEHGHSHVAYIALYKAAAQEDRILGFKTALRERFPLHDSYDVFYGECPNAQALERGHRLAEELLERGMPYTALFVTNNRLALGIAQGMREHGYRIPEDMSLLCFNDSPEIGEYGMPLSALACEPLQMGEMTVDMLMQRLNNRCAAPFTVRLCPQLIERGSVRDISAQKEAAE